MSRLPIAEQVALRCLQHADERLIPFSQIVLNRHALAAMRIGFAVQHASDEAKRAGTGVHAVSAAIERFTRGVSL